MPVAGWVKFRFILRLITYSTISILPDSYVNLYLINNAHVQGPCEVDILPSTKLNHALPCLRLLSLLVNTCAKQVYFFILFFFYR